MSNEAATNSIVNTSSTSGFTWDQNNPLAHHKGERRNAWEAFRDYVRMGPGRSLAKLARGYGGEYTQEEEPLLYAFFKPYMQQGADGATVPPTTSLRTVSGWSAKYAWQARLDRHLELQEADRTRRLREMRAELERCDYQDGQALRQTVRKLLTEMDSFIKGFTDVEELTDPEGNKVIVKTIHERMDATITQVATALKTASDLQRLAAGVSTSNSRLIDEDGKDVQPAVIGIRFVQPTSSSED